MITSELLALEQSLLRAKRDLTPSHVAEVQHALQNLIDPQRTVDQARSLTDFINHVMTDAGRRRAAALAILRSLGIAEILQNKQFELPVVQLVEQAAPDIFKAYVSKEQKQTYDKYRRLEDVHHLICEKLSVLAGVSETMADFMSARTEILRVLNNSIVKSYLQPYDIQSIIQAIQTIFVSLDKIDETKNHEFLLLLSTLQTLVKSYCQTYVTQESFFSQDFLMPLLSSALSVCKTF